MIQDEIFSLSQEQKKEINKILNRVQAQSADDEIRQQPNFPQSGNVRAKASAKHLSIGVSTFWLWVKQGKIKPPTKHGNRVSVWDAEYIRNLAENGVSGDVAK